MSVLFPCVYVVNNEYKIFPSDLFDWKYRHLINWCKFFEKKNVENIDHSKKMMKNIQYCNPLRILTDTFGIKLNNDSISLSPHFILSIPFGLSLPLFSISLLPFSSHCAFLPPSSPLFNYSFSLIKINYNFSSQHLTNYIILFFKIIIIKNTLKYNTMS